MLIALAIIIILSAITAAFIVGHTIGFKTGYFTAVEDAEARNDIDDIQWSAK